MKMDKLREQDKEVASTTLFHLAFISYWMEMTNTEWSILTINFITT